MKFEQFNNLDIKSFKKDYNNIQSFFRNDKKEDEVEKESIRYLLQCERDMTDGNNFLYSYFLFLGNQIDNNFVMENHWSFFSKGWASAPFFLSVLVDDKMSVRNRKVAFHYLYAFIVPFYHRKEIFSKYENFFLGKEMEPPEFIVDYIWSIITKHRKDDPKLHLLINEKIIFLLKTDKKHRDFTRTFKSYDPSDSFEGYELPEEF